MCHELGLKILHIVMDNLVLVHNKMKQHVNQRQYESPFEEADHAFFHLQLYKHTSLKEKSYQKFIPRFYILYLILKLIGHVAYKLPPDPL